MIECVGLVNCMGIALAAAFAMLFAGLAVKEYDKKFGLAMVYILMSATYLFMAIAL